MDADPTCDTDRNPYPMAMHILVFSARRRIGQISHHFDVEPLV
jgi:hypothetical protein